jgi:hypothetical protein
LCKWFSCRGIVFRTDHPHLHWGKNICQRLITHENVKL